MEMHGASMEFHSSPWNSREFRGVPWNSMELHGIPWGYFTRELSLFSQSNGRAKRGTANSLLAG